MRLAIWRLSKHMGSELAAINGYESVLVKI